jgi:hypothetical protein
MSYRSAGSNAVLLGITATPKLAPEMVGGNSPGTIPSDPIKQHFKCRHRAINIVTLREENALRETHIEGVAATFRGSLQPDMAGVTAIGPTPS